MGHGTNGTASGEGHVGTAWPAHNLHRSASLPYQAPVQGAGGRSSSAKTAPAISSTTRVTPLCTLLCPLGAVEMLCPGTSNLQGERFGAQLGPSTHTSPPYTAMHQPWVGRPQAHLAPGTCPMVSHVLHLKGVRPSSTAGAGLIQAVPLTAGEALRAEGGVGAGQCGVQGHCH